MKNPVNTCGSITCGLTESGYIHRIATVPRRELVSRDFGRWLKYVRERATSNPKHVAADARVSEDAIRRIERGELPSGSHFLGWLSWLAEQDSVVARGDFRKELLDRLLEVGRKARELGLASRPAKAKSWNPPKRKRTAMVEPVRKEGVRGQAPSGRHKRTG